MALNTTFVAGNVLTAAQMNNLPFGSAGYATNTSLSQTVTTLTDITSLSVTFTAVANRIYKVEGWVYLATTEGTNVAGTYIRNGATTLQVSAYNLQIANVAYSTYVCYVGTFTAGSTTLKLSAQRQAGSGTVTASAAATNPAQFLVTDIGLT
jgi:hypothetical protein